MCVDPSPVLHMTGLQGLVQQLVLLDSSIQVFARQQEEDLDEGDRRGSKLAAG